MQMNRIEFITIATDLFHDRFGHEFEIIHNRPVVYEDIKYVLFKYNILPDDLTHYDLSSYSFLSLLDRSMEVLSHEYLEATKDDVAEVLDDEDEETVSSDTRQELENKITDLLNYVKEMKV